MKTLYTTYRDYRIMLPLSFLVFLLVSCEDVIEVDIPENEPRLIVDALVRVDTTQAFTPLRIRVSRTSSFFDPITPAVIDQISITNENTSEFIILQEDPNEPGIYIPFPIIGSVASSGDAISTAFLTSGDRLTMSVRDGEEIILAFAQFVPTVPVDSLAQGDEVLFDEDDTEVIVAFTDDPERNDFYVFDFDFNEFITAEDTFFQGQQFQFSFFYDSDDTGISPGDEVTISILGADEPFFNYMNQVIEQSEQGDNGPFQTPAATVRGNFINATDIDNIDNFNNVDMPDNFILGYFAIVQEFQNTLVIE